MSCVCKVCEWARHLMKVASGEVPRYEGLRRQSCLNPSCSDVSASGLFTVCGECLTEHVFLISETASVDATTDALALKEAKP